MSGFRRRQLLAAVEERKEEEEWIPKPKKSIEGPLLGTFNQSSQIQFRQSPLQQELTRHLQNRSQDMRSWGASQNRKLKIERLSRWDHWVKEGSKRYNNIAGEYVVDDGFDEEDDDERRVKSENFDSAETVTEDWSNCIPGVHYEEQKRGRSNHGRGRSRHRSGMREEMTSQPLWLDINVLLVDAVRNMQAANNSGSTLIEKIGGSDPDLRAHRSLI